MPFDLADTRGGWLVEAGGSKKISPSWGMLVRKSDVRELGRLNGFDQKPPYRYMIGLVTI